MSGKQGGFHPLLLTEPYPEKTRDKLNERLIVIEKALKTLHESAESADAQLVKAAKSLLSDYKKHKNLTAFTAIDFEKFYEAQ